MPEQKSVVMPFGRHRGRAVHEVDSSYLRWCLSDCRDLGADLSAAIRAELARRDALARALADRRERALADHQPAAPVAPDPAPAAVAADPPLMDPAAVFALLSDLLAVGGVKIVARGEGAVHAFGVRRLTPRLRALLALCYGAIDDLARWVRFEGDAGTPRVTPASVLLARLRSSGVAVSALPGGGVAVTPGGDAAGADPLQGLTNGSMNELWFRLAVNFPDDAPATAAATCRVRSNSMAGLHAYCAARASQRRARFAGVVAALRAGQAVGGEARRGLADHCRRQAESAQRRGHEAAARRWRAWLEAVAEPTA